MNRTGNHQRKTVRVADVVDDINRMLEHSNDDKVEAREALAVFIEGLLLDTNNYAGYRYLGGPWTGDETRRRYHCKGQPWS